MKVFYTAEAVRRNPMPNAPNMRTLIIKSSVSEKVMDAARRASLGAIAGTTIIITRRAPNDRPRIIGSYRAGVYRETT